MSDAMATDQTQMDAHEHELEPTGRGSGLDEEFRCTICGLTTTVREGVKSAREQRKW